jgi:NAD(P)-dependent dehydrogenase (short-subunit alcohol dehydrogenase family)
MKKILSEVRSFCKRSISTMFSLRKFYRTGGFASFKIVNINYGKVLEGKNILVTGGSSGIGFCIARKCIEHGARVVITGRNIDKLNKAESIINSSLLHSVVWDVSKVSQVDGMIEECRARLGGNIDILVNNAGILNSVQFPYVTEGVWDEIYATNSKGLFFLTQCLCKFWLVNEHSSLKKVINISSQGGFVGATYPYRMTKWDIAGLTQGLGVKLASKGIIVNGIAPGVVATEMQPDTLKQKDNIYYPDNAVERFALPEEIAELALFLMGDASNFIVGQTIVCDGGFSIK